jgi:undecaprenyl-diphosphatase
MSIVETLNQAAFLRINADLTTVAWKLNIAAVTADYLIYLIPLILVALWCWGNESQRTLALKACVVALVALGVNQLLSILWPHPRPLMMGLGHTFIPHAIDSSFPSDHATVFCSDRFDASVSEYPLGSGMVHTFARRLRGMGAYFSRRAFST